MNKNELLKDLKSITFFGRPGYHVYFYSCGSIIDNMCIDDLNIAINQAIYSINHTNMIIIDRVKIFKHGNLVAELNK